MSPVTISSLDHLVMTVRDIDATIEFYTGFLGMNVTSFRDGTRKALRFGAQKINLHELYRSYELTAEVWVPGCDDLCFLTDTPVADVVRHANALGIKIIEGRGSVPEPGGRSCQSMCAIRTKT
jgi:catechol 2,3-dioxygenase-like lactoylglutathione lyase family enzyme